MDIRDGVYYGNVRVDNKEMGQAVLTVKTDSIETTTGTGSYTTDWRWEFVDEAGHFHAWSDGGTLPTLILVFQDQEGEFDEDGPVRLGVWTCRVCGQAVEPARVPDFGRTFVPGMTSWEVSIAGDVALGATVSVVFQSRGQSKIFGFGVVSKVDYSGDYGARVQMTTIAGHGPLGRKKPGAL